MENTTYKEYWKAVRQNSKDKTNKKLGIEIRILAIVVGLISTAIKSISSGGNLNTILYDFGINFLIILILWIIVWFGFFVYYRAHESVVLYNNLENKIISLERVSFIASKSQNIRSGNFVFEQVKLINSSSQDLNGCFVLVENFYEVKESINIPIEPASRNISWSTTGRRTPDNKVTLIKGIPENLYIARIDSDGTSCLMGEGGNNTLLEKEKNYILHLRVVGDNFSPHAMMVTLECGKDGSVNIKEVTNPSYIDFRDVKMSAGKVHLPIKTELKRNWRKVFGLRKH